MITQAKRRQSLEDRLKELNWKLVEIEDALEDTPDPDVEERAVERESDEVLEGIGNASQTEIRMIKAALERMEQGEYGNCTICGDPVSEERLDLLPATPFCRSCAH